MESFAVLSGYITDNPKTETTPTGKTVMNFTLSVYARFKKQEDGKKHVSFFNCIYWPNEKPEGNIQREVAKLVKGELVIFKAEPVQERWEKDGQKHSIIKWNVDGWVELMKHHKAESTGKPDQQDIDPDDCPF